MTVFNITNKEIILANIARVVGLASRFRVAQSFSEHILSSGQAAADVRGAFRGGELQPLPAPSGSPGSST